MKNVRFFVAGIAGAFALSASAQSKQGGANDDRIRVTSADELFDGEVVTSDGREIGDVEYVLIESATGKIRNVVVESELDQSEDQLIAIPWSALNPEMMGGELQIQTTLDKVKEAPRTSRAEIQRIAQPSIMMQVERYWIPLDQPSEPAEGEMGQQPKTEDQPETAEPEARAGAEQPKAGKAEPRAKEKQGQTAASAEKFLLIGARTYALLEPSTTTLREVEGMDLKGSGGRSIGEVEEVVIDADDGHVAYLLVGHGGFLGLGQKFVPVPLQAIDFLGDEDARLKLSEQKFTRMTGYSDDDVPRFVNKDDLAKVYRQFNVAPYWTAKEEMARRPAAEG